MERKISTRRSEELADLRRPMAGHAGVTCIPLHQQSLASEAHPFQFQFLNQHHHAVQRQSSSRAPPTQPAEKSVRPPPHIGPNLSGTHLEFRHRKVHSQTRPWAIHKGEQVSMSMNLFGLGRYPVLTWHTILEPSTRPEHLGVFTPDCNRPVDGLHGNRNDGAFCDRHAIDQLS